MHILFRADASVEMGTGHIMRCLTLADELRRRGADIHFVTRAHAGHLADLIANKGYSVTLLPLPAEPYHRSGDEPAHAAWLGVNWEEDVRETLTALEQIGGVDWLVVDHYALDHRWETALRPLTKRLFVIDDLADRIHDCDVLLDQNLQPEGGNRYAGLVSDTCRLLLGPRFALLRPEFREARKRLRPRDGKVRRILIFFGGTDPYNLTSLALEAVRSLHREDISVDVVVGSGNPRREAVRKECEIMLNAIYHCQTDDMAGLMERADLAIGASGSTTWERAAVGLPTLAIAMAINQQFIAQKANIEGLFTYLGAADGMSTLILYEFLETALRNPELLLVQGRRACELVDGNGMQRAIEAVWP